MVNVGLKTYNLKKEEIERKWYLIDAKDKNLGRLCTEAVSYTHLDVYKRQSLTIPGYLEVDLDNLKGRLLRYPERDEIKAPINEQVIIELYSKY